jgi:hypothetical protein
MTDLPQPLTPADCNLREFPFMPLEVKRLLSSETWVLGTGDERSAAITLWLESWHQVPAGSLPDNERMLDHLSQAKNWKKVKAHALRGWVRCSDGRLYHAVVAEKALEAWLSKLVSSFTGSFGNAKRWGIEIDTESVRAKVIEAVELLRAIEPRSEWLFKKQVKSIVEGSPPESPPDPKKHRPRSQKPSPPESGPESPPDRNREGEGEREGLEPLGSKTSIPSIVDSKAKNDDDFVPKNEADWLRHLRARHGFEADPTNVNDRRRCWQTFARWVNAGVKASQVDAAIAKAHAESSEPISNIVAYADRVLETMTAPKRPKADEWHRTNEGVKRKARELGFGDGRANETWDALKERCWVEIRKREQQGATA